MSAKQPEALRLANTFDHPLPPEWSDMKAAAAELRRLHHQTEVLRAERDRARACYDATVKLLAGIHALLYPAPTTLLDGRVMVFRPKSLDPHEVLQELSDRIRALPHELEKATAIQQAESKPVKGAEWREVIQGAIDELPYQHHLIPRLVALLSANHPAPGVPVTDADALLDFMEAHRVSVTPEYEGPWCAQRYDDEPQFFVEAEGATPREALRALAAAQEQKGGA